MSRSSRPVVARSRLSTPPEPPDSSEAAAASRATCSPIVDLRQYTLYPGTRDGFVELFDREFVETQEAAGMRVIGQFRDLGDPNRFVWLRGFPNMPSRQKALTDFYLHGAAWRTHSEVARSKMIDSTDALLLRPARADSGFSLEPPESRPALDSAVPQGVIVITIYSLPAPADADFLAFFEGTVGQLLRGAGAIILACSSPNTAGTTFLVSHCAKTKTSSSCSLGLMISRPITRT